MIPSCDSVRWDLDRSSPSMFNVMSLRTLTNINMSSTSSGIEWTALNSVVVHRRTSPWSSPIVSRNTLFDFCHRRKISFPEGYRVTRLNMTQCHRWWDRRSITSEQIKARVSVSLKTSFLIRSSDSDGSALSYRITSETIWCAMRSTCRLLKGFNPLTNKTKKKNNLSLNIYPRTAMRRKSTWDLLNRHENRRNRVQRILLFRSYASNDRVWKSREFDHLNVESPCRYFSSRMIRDLSAVEWRGRIRGESLEPPHRNSKEPKQRQTMISEQSPSSSTHIDLIGSIVMKIENTVEIRIRCDD